MPPAQEDSPVPPAGGHGAATPEMRDAQVTGPRNEIDIHPHKVKAGEHSESITMRTGDRLT